MGLGAAVGGIVDAIGSFVGGLGAADLGAGLAGAAGDFTAGGAEGLFAAGGSGLADVGAGAAGAGLAGAAGDFTAGGAEGLYAAGGSGLADAGTAAGALGAAGVDGFGATSAAAPAAGVSGAAGAATPASAALGTAPVATAGPSAASISPIAGTGPADLTAAGAASGIGAPASGAGAAGDFTAAGAEGGYTGAGAGSGIGNAWNAVTGALTGPTAKTLGVGVAGLGLARDLIAGNSLPKGSNEIQSLAAQSASQGQILQSYLETGTLPPAVQASVNAATQAGISAIQSKYASMGVAPGSSGEVADIASLRNQAVYQGANLADQLLQQGISETQLSGQLYEQLVQTQLGLDQETSQAIGGLATALSGGIKLGNSGVVVA